MSEYRVGIYGPYLIPYGTDVEIMTDVIIHLKPLATKLFDSCSIQQQNKQCSTSQMIREWNPQ